MFHLKKIKNISLFIFLTLVGTNCYSANMLEKLTQQIPEEYIRDEYNTYKDIPERALSLSSEEYSNYIKINKPSKYPFLTHIRQFWDIYDVSYGYLEKNTSIDTKYRNKLIFMGTVDTFESIISSLYESTVGHLTEKTSLTDEYITEEDLYAIKTSQDYNDFIKTNAWYKYNYYNKFLGLWQDNALWGNNPIRKIERRLALTNEYLFKSGYSYIFRLLFNPIEQQSNNKIAIIVDELPYLNEQQKNSIEIIKDLKDREKIITVALDNNFNTNITELAFKGSNFKSISGNTGEIIISFFTHKDFKNNNIKSEVFYERFSLSNSDTKIIYYKVKVSQLADILRQLKMLNIPINHIYTF